MSSNGSAIVAQNLAHAGEAEGLEPTHVGATFAEGTETAHADPTLLGLNGTAVVGWAMLVLILIMIWKKVPSAIGGALDKKIAGIRVQLDEAKRLRAEAEALKAEYQAKAAAIAAGDDDLVDLRHIRLSRGLGRDLIGRLREGGERRDGRDDQRRRAENSVLHLDYPQRA